MVETIGKQIKFTRDAEGNWILCDPAHYRLFDDWGHPADFDATFEEGKTLPAGYYGETIWLTQMIAEAVARGYTVIFLPPEPDGSTGRQ